MTKTRWLSASLFALLLSGTAVWSQGTPLSLQGLLMLSGPQVGQDASTESEAPARPVLPQIDPVADEGRDIRDLNQARPPVGDEEESETASLDAVAECLRAWALAFKQGDYPTARCLAEKACKIDPNNVAAQHACVVTRLVSRLNASAADAGCGACSEAKCCEGKTCETGCCEAKCASACKAKGTKVAKGTCAAACTASCSSTREGSKCSMADACCSKVARVLCMPSACSAIFSFWNPMFGCSGGVNTCCQASSDCCQSDNACAKACAKNGDKGCCCATKGSGCCGNCACCKPQGKTQGQRAAAVFQGMIGGEMRPPIVISGFCPLGMHGMPGLPPGMPWAGPMPPPMGLPMPGSVPTHFFKLASRAAEAQAQSAFQIKAAANSVHITTPNLDARCDRMTCLGTRDRVLLEGNVRLTCKKDGQTTRIEAPCVLVDLLHGSFTVETANVPPPPCVGSDSCPADQALLEMMMEE